MKKILMISPEVYPEVKVGGLGRVAAGLIKGLKENDIEIKVVSPKESIYSSLYKKETELKNRCLGQKASNLCITDRWQPDWVWVHDWGGVWSADEFKKYNQKAKVVWTVHSPISLSGYGGYGYSYGYEYSSSGENEKVDWGDSFFDFSSLIKRGIDVADKTTTVSKSFARVLKNSSLFSQTNELVGINNGLDLSEWNSNKIIDKKADKRKLQEMFDLPMTDCPVFTFISRLVSQKGLDLLLKILPEFVAKNNVQFVFLGGGNRKYVDKINEMKRKFSRKIGAKTESDFEMPHKILAGSDFLVLPSISEPFGMVVAEAKRYGVVPIVHLVDGLRDQVRDKVNGLGFESYNEVSLREKLEEAIRSYGSEWQIDLSKNLMNEVFDWTKVSKEWLSYLYA